MGWSTITYDASAFIAGLFLLEYGADTFIDHTAIIARRAGVSQTLVALLTAGAEWEELAVVVAAILQNNSSLALGNVIGSSISNVLGAFSLGLLFSPDGVEFDRSAKIYTVLLFLLTSVFTVVALTRNLGKIAGGIFIGVFALYLVSIGSLIYRGVLSAPEDSDSDSSDSDSDSDEEYDETHDSNNAQRHRERNVEETTHLIHNPDVERSKRSWKHSLRYHTLQLILGFVALSLSGYILSHSAASLANAFSLSNTVVGVTILSFATTLPEKFVAVIGGSKGHGGIVVASTAGSNIFLLTLCLGVTFVAGNQTELMDSLVPFEVWSAWASSALFLFVVLSGSRKWKGGVLLVLYIGFIVLEFTIFRR